MAARPTSAPAPEAARWLAAVAAAQGPAPGPPAPPAAPQLASDTPLSHWCLQHVMDLTGRRFQMEKLCRYA